MEVRVLLSPSAHERQCEALGFVDRRFQVLMTRLERRFSRLEGESFDLHWTRKLGVFAKTSLLRNYRKIARKLLMRHLIVVLGPKLHIRKQVLSRESHGVFFFFPRKLLPSESKRPSPNSQGWHNQITGPVL